MVMRFNIQMINDQLRNTGGGTVTIFHIWSDI